MVEQFCKSILQLGIKRCKGLANLVMGLGSQTFARSVVEVSLSPCYHFQHSSINKAIDEIFSEAKEPEKEEGCHSSAAIDRQEVEKKFISEEGFTSEALRKVLVAEHRQQSAVSASFTDAASKEVRL